MLGTKRGTPKGDTRPQKHSSKSVKKQAYLYRENANRNRKYGSVMLSTVRVRSIIALDQIYNIDDYHASNRIE